MEPLAAITIPVLAWRSGIIRLARIHPSDVDLMRGPADMADLPVGFRALWLETSYLFWALQMRAVQCSRRPTIQRLQRRNCVDS